MYDGLEFEESKVSGPVALVPLPEPVKLWPVYGGSPPVRRRSILKITDNDKGNTEGARSRRCFSMPGVGDWESADDEKKRVPPFRHRVSFTVVDIQEHGITLGDHPDCSFGPPITLDWKVNRRHSLDIEEFEEKRKKTRRPLHDLVLHYCERKELLTGAGHTEEEIRRATDDVKREKARRKTTKMYANSPIFKVEQALACAARRIKRATEKVSKKNAKDPQEESSMDSSGSGRSTFNIDHNMDFATVEKREHQGAQCPPMAPDEDLRHQPATPASA